MKTIFETERFIIREYSPAEMEGWIALLTHPEIGRYLPKHSPEKWAAIFNNNLEAYEQNTGLSRWAVADKTSNKIVGNAMLAPARDGLDGFELGYAFEKELWGTGAGTEVVNGILNYGFNQLSIDMVCAITAPQNIGSVKVLEKAGFASKGTINLGNADLLLFEKQRHP